MSDDTPEELRLLFRPQFTVAADKKDHVKVPPRPLTAWRSSS